MKRALIFGTIVVAGILVYAAALQKPAAPSQQQTMLLTSSAFEQNAYIPKKFSCEGWNINPELLIQGVPQEAKSLALIMDDPDAPRGTFTHWLVWKIDPTTTVIKEESVPPGSIEGANDAGKIGYIGPCPPPGAPHRYFFKLYALDVLLDLKSGASKTELEAALRSHSEAQTELVGLYAR